MSKKKLGWRVGFKRLAFRLFSKAGSFMSGLRRESRARVFRPPGSCVYRFINAVFPRQKVESIFSPIIIRWQTEYCAELFAGRDRQAKLLRVTYTWMLIKAMGGDRIFTIILSAIDRVKAI